MAEINIERKKKPVWPWVFLVILLALVAWVIYEVAYEREEVEIEEVPATGMIEPEQGLYKTKFDTALYVKTV